MSGEKIRHGAEFKIENTPETGKEGAEHAPRHTEHHEKQHNKEHLAEIHKRVETHAISGKEVAPSEKEHRPATNHHVGKDLKDLAYNRSLTRVRKRLNTPEKAFSRLVHQPVVDKVSEFTASTVARPAGLLGGGLVALIGTSALLYLVRKYGYEFNYLVLLLLFAGGFMAGYLLEAIVKLALRRRKQRY